MLPRLSDRLRAFLGLCQPTARAAAAPQLVLGPYLLEERLHLGGSCAVYRGRRADTGEPVAIKLLHSDRTSARAAERFEREIHLTRSLSHPHIVRVLDWGHDPSSRLYCAMELLDGLPLVELIDRYGPQPDGRVVHLLRQAASALAAVHAAGVVHRDIKPANLLLCPGEAPHDLLKVLDFGLSCSQERPIADAWGTPGYRAPEETAGRPPSPAGDLYALGVVACDLLTGSTACRRSGAPALRDFWGRELVALVEQLTAADPRQRTESAAALIEALDDYRPRQSWTAADAWSWWYRRANYTPTEPQRLLVEPLP